MLSYFNPLNVNSSGTNWSEYFPNVINVGAYNVDQSGASPQFGEISQLYTTDIFADGLVYNSSFNSNGWNFLELPLLLQ